MGLFDKLKKSFGGSSDAVETVKGPSRTLRDAGLDPSGLTFDIQPDGVIVVAGRVNSADERNRVGEVLGGMPNVTGVDNRLDVGVAAPEPAPEPELESGPAPTPAPEPPVAAPPAATEVASGAPPPDDAGRTYTVQPGDSLWKIAEEMYGNGSKYPVIFEANRDLLDNPDKIFPGQELKIPDLDPAED